MSVFLNDTATTEIYTLSLHDALPIYVPAVVEALWRVQSSMHQVTARAASIPGLRVPPGWNPFTEPDLVRSAEHTSELQSRQYLVCRLLLEKKTHNQGTITCLFGSDEE